jgi:LmbE family N-acetylglucosaminyl deacetylase
LDDVGNLRSGYLLIRRPHFHLRANALFFLLSERPSRVLEKLEIEIWNLMSRPVSIDSIREIYGERTEPIIREFLRGEFCERVETTFPSGRRRVLVIEPHADDAALSVGGMMWLRRFDCEYIVATMASRSNHTIYYDQGRDYFGVKEVTEIRRRESELFSLVVGGDHLSVGLIDAPLRYCDANWTLDYFLRHRTSISVSLSRAADDPDRELWSAAVQKLLADVPSAEVWIPLGGPHTDHMLTADACFAAFASNPSLINGRILRLYEDIPYASRNPLHMNTVLEALRKAGVVWEEELHSIDSVYDQKLRLASVYSSQHIRDMQVDVEATARNRGAGVGYAELLRTVRRLPDRVHPSGIVSSAIAEYDPGGEIAVWVSRHKAENCVRILLQMPTGRWTDDLQHLLRVFARARFEVYVASAAGAEVSRSLSDRIALRHVADGAAAWIAVALRISLAMRPLPTLFYVSSEQLRQARLISKLWLGSDTLVVASMDELVSALRAQH